MSEWCRRCGGPVDGGGCEACRRSPPDDRSAPAEVLLAKHRAALADFVQTQTSCHLEDALDKLVEHFLPEREAARRQLQYCRPRSSWQFEVHRDGAVERVLKVPPGVAAYFGTVLHLLSVDDPGARALWTLTSTQVERVPLGYAIVRRPGRAHAPPT